jgi:hypothetical protein
MTTQSLARFFRRWLKLSLFIALMIVVIFLALPTLFKLLNVPSFALEVSPSIWLLRWQNLSNVEFGFSFNVVLLGAIAAVIGLIITSVRSRHTI